MADVTVTPWDEVDVDETITEADQVAADQMDAEKQPGVFLCEVTECNAIEKTKKPKNAVAYVCYSAALKYKIHQVIELNQPIMGEDKKPIIREGVIVASMQPVADDKKEAISALYVGSTLQDEVDLYHPKETEFTKKRRIFVAQRMGLISKAETEMKSSIWPGSVGSMVIIKTQWNLWTNAAGEKQKNIKIDFFAGYDFASKAPGLIEASKTIEVGDGAENSDEEDFDI